MSNTPKLDPDKLFCDAMASDVLKRHDILFDSIKKLYDNGDRSGICRMIDLVAGTEHRGYSKTLLIALKPIKNFIGEDEYEKIKMIK